MQFNERRLVSITDTRRRLGGIGRTTVYELIKRRELVKVNIGSRGFVTGESLDSYLDRLGRSVTGGDDRHDSLTAGADGEAL